MGGEASQSFKILLIASEILVPVIIFVGAYFILKPYFNNKEKQDQE
tara:strand:- start:158 stop:295 length:138 start_codon:yes stop_codon:yes gene_type:complete